MQVKKRIQSVTLTQVQDPDPDTSYLGEYSDTCTSEFSIDRAHLATCASVLPETRAAADMLERSLNYLHAQKTGMFEYPPAVSDALDIIAEARDAATDCDCSHNMERGKYRYFNQSFNYVDKTDKPLPGTTPDDVRRYVAEDYARMEALNDGEWSYIGIRAEAEVLVGDTIQRIRSGGLWGIESDSDPEYLAEVGAEELAQLKEQLYAIGFSKRAIATACKNLKDEVTK